MHVNKYSTRQRRRGTTFFSHRSQILGLAALGALGFLSNAAHAGLTYSFQEIDTLGGSSSTPHAINVSGVVAGHANVPLVQGDEEENYHAFKLVNGVMTDLGTLGGPLSTAYGINSSNQIVGYARIDASTAHATIWSPSGTPSDMGTLGLSSIAYGINDSGSAVGSSFLNASQQHAFIWTSGSGMTDIGTLGGSSSVARAINASGTIVGDSNTSNGQNHAFVRIGNTMTDLQTLGGTNSTAYAINTAGDIVGYSTKANNQTHAFIYTGGVMTDLNTLGGSYSFAYGINNFGQIVGTSVTTGSFDDKAFIYANGTMTDLNTLTENVGTFVLQTPQAINDNGQIAGYGTPDGDNTRGFLLNPILGWTNTAGGDFNTASNYGTVIKPSNVSALVFNTGSANPYTVNLAANSNSTNFTVGNDKVTMQLNGHVLNLSGAVNVGKNSGDSAQLTLAGGTYITGPVQVAPVAGSTATMTLSSGSVWHAGAIYVGGNNAGAAGTGTFNMNGASLDSLSLTVYSGGTFNQNSGTVSISSVNLQGGKFNLAAGHNKTMVVNSLTIAAGSKLDIADNAMVIQYGGATPIATIRQYLKNGRGATDGFDNGETWNGSSGIVSTTASANVFQFGIGYAENSDMPFGSYTSFAGQSVGSSSILIKYTKNGDTDLNGVVDDTDVGAIVTYYHKTQPFTAQWAYGDCDYDGQVDDDDVAVMATLYNPTATPVSPAQLSAMYGSDFAAAWEKGRAMAAAGAVPEPASLSVVAGFIITTMSRRRKNTLNLSRSLF